ncbi:Gfo/Idh/MocA family oxidoreductase [Marinomonas ostreistagni]|uniref:Gfo/Idh/MocA family oxidoreductase n=1 Tax=Marinomonas ostreistagni TaxID=359209 RepID=UPI00194EE7FE|nr:Gfo/Idh/MocA family oxidoreductase [Marinomonas ostreistagni]MBM6550623.1 Gfo/Idh/MocA family oxidoreductase [Marinomonas ostreistagni]
MTIRVGIIGFGLSGRVFHAPFVAHQAGMTLSYICSSSPEKVHQYWPDVAVVSDAEALIQSDDIDLVVITTPNELHYAQAKLALESGKHVLLEKPAVTELEQMEALCRLAREQNRVLSVYQNRRFDGDFLRLKALVETQELGQLKQLESRFDRFRPEVQERWREQPGVGTGIFWDLGPHVMDQALALLGTPDWVQADIGTLREGGSAADTFDVTLAYGKRRVYLGASLFEAGAMRRYNARFDGGSWHCYDLDAQEDALRAGELPGQPDFASTKQRAACYLAPSQHDVTATDEAISAGRYVDFYQQLTVAIQGQGEAPVTLKQACELVYAMTLAEHSARTGERQSWQYQSAF